MNRNNMLKIIGLIYILMWITQVPYLFPHPFQQHEGIKKIAAETTQIPDFLKEESGIKDKTAGEIENAMLTEWRIKWIEYVILIVVGIISGCLFIQRRKLGYFLTFFLSLLLLCFRFFHLLKNRSLSFSLEYYELLLKHMPLRTIHGFLIQLILFITVVYISYLFLTRNHGNFNNETHNKSFN